jgi:WD40 repeat protein
VTPDTVICPDCGGPPEAPAPSQPQGTVLADQPRGTVLMSQPAYQRMCILCGQDFTTPDPQADRCPQCRGEAPQPQPEIRSRPESRQPTPAMPAPAQGTVAMPESGMSSAPSSADVPLEWNAGDVILDLYEVKGELGKGGMGVVYRVHHRQWNIDLAVKTPLPEALQKAGSLENFLREAQAWVDLGLHPHIVTCYYVRRLGEMPRVFAECMEGGSLKNWMEDGRLYAGGEQDALKRILDCAIQFAWGLGYAHEKGLVHQDVKPANALMTPDGMLKVTDFGLVGAKGYTPAYAAPEQELGQAVSPRTDIWGWGVSVLEMFTGGVHWQFGSVAASVLENYLQEAPPEGIPPMPAALAELLRQCFQNDPDQRPASMDEVAERLMRLYEQETGAPYPRPKPQALDMRADSLNNKAVSLLDLGLEEEAVRCWQEALQADPAHLEANFNYGYYRWHKAELPGSEFLKQLQRLESTHGSDPEYWRLLGWVYLEQGKPDERLLLVGYSNGTMELWDLEAKVCQRVLEGHTSAVRSIVVSRDGRLALSGSEDATVRLWDLETGKCIILLTGHIGGIESVALSLDCKRALSGGEDKTVRLWDLQRGEMLSIFEGHRDKVIRVGFLSADTIVFSASLDGRLLSWYVETGQKTDILNFNLEIGQRSLIDFVISPQQDYAIALLSYYVRAALWSLETRQKHQLIGHKAPIISAAIFPNNKYAITLSDNLMFKDQALRLWELPTGRELASTKVSIRWPRTVACSSSWVVVAGGSTLGGDRGIVATIWRMQYSEIHLPTSIHPYPALSRVKETITISAIQRTFQQYLNSANALLSRGFANEPYVLLRRAQMLPGYKRSDDILAFLAQCGTKGQRSTLQGSWLLMELNDSGEYAFSPDGRYVLVASEELHVWDLEKGVIIKHFENHNSDIRAVAVSANAQLALMGDEYGNLTLWDLENGNPLRRMVNHKEAITVIAFLPDKRYALSGGEDNTLRLWDLDAGEFVPLWRVSEGKQVRVMRGHDEPISAIAISPDGKMVYSGSLDCTICIWELATGKRARHRRWKKIIKDAFSVAIPPTAIVVSPNGRNVLVSWDDMGDPYLEIRDIETGKSVQCLVGHTGTIYSAAMLSDEYALTGSNDCTLRIWNIRTGQGQVIGEHRYGIKAVAFSQDGRCAFSAGLDGTIKVWALDWDYDFPDPADWDEGARPYLDIFLTLHTPYGPDGLSRVGKPQWTEEDFQKLLQELGYRGYGWLRPEGVRRELEKMAKERS